MRSCPLAFSDKRTDTMYSVTALSPRGTRRLLIGFVLRARDVADSSMLRSNL